MGLKAWGQGLIGPFERQAGLDGAQAPSGSAGSSVEGDTTDPVSRPADRMVFLTRARAVGPYLAAVCFPTELAAPVVRPTQRAAASYEDGAVGGDGLAPGAPVVVLAAASATRAVASMTVAATMPRAELGGLRGRPPVGASGSPGIHLAGDWVGPDGLLADAALASGHEAGRRALAALGRSVRTA